MAFSIVGLGTELTSMPRRTTASSAAARPRCPGTTCVEHPEAAAPKSTMPINMSRNQRPVGPGNVLASMIETSRFSDLTIAVPAAFSVLAQCGQVKPVLWQRTGGGRACCAKASGRPGVGRRGVETSGGEEFQSG